MKIIKTKLESGTIRIKLIPVSTIKITIKK